jgi:hypothetical protein
MVQDEGIQGSPSRLLKLRKWNYKSKENKMARVHKTEDKQQLTAQRTPGICRSFLRI